MSIQSEITRISGNVANTLTAIANKGVTVPQGSNSDDMATLINSIVFQHYYTGTSTPSSSLGSNGDIYLQTSN